eukprot:TRINITY_DN1988_c0_g1_i10.p1 TRINITY_DN1988_c0_g1~~TRINITY_DN1988_c0_g1_i10.p1  ORF type:complete len:480 (+),score=125.75 TRINITY_DN1988_c0_g1_i10:223-1662(+)
MSAGGTPSAGSAPVPSSAPAAAGSSGARKGGAAGSGVQSSSRSGSSSTSPSADAHGGLITIDKEWSTFSACFQRLLRLFHEEKAQLAVEREQLAKERAEFEAMKRRIESVNKMHQNRVTLNIGGTTFETTRETLTAEEGSMLEAMFSGRFNVEKEESGACFIDRDDANFPLILSYLRERRDGIKPKKLAMESHRAERVLREANFYGLEGLERLIIASTSLVVAQDGSGKYTRIQDAIRDASDGDRILVQPGTYFEYLVLEKNVEIVGDIHSDKDTVAVTFSGEHVVTSCAERAALKNIVINQQGDEFHCLFITKGCLRVDGCTFMSSGWACIGISGENTHPFLTNNRIVSSSDNGIIILSKGKGVIEGNDIAGYTLQGIEIREESNPVVRGNRIHHGKDSGIYINTKGRGIIEGNEIYSNDFNGIAIKFEGQPKRVCGNKIHGNRQKGIYISSDSGAEGVEPNNEVYGNSAGDFVEELT